MQLLYDTALRGVLQMGFPLYSDETLTASYGERVCVVSEPPKVIVML